VLGEVAKAHAATPFQIALAWLVMQPRVITIPMSFNPCTSRNFDAADIELSADEIQQLNNAWTEMNLQVTPDIEITEETETELEPLYRVIIHNDDVTPMDFVVHVLTSIFFLSNRGAMEVMLTAPLQRRCLRPDPSQSRGAETHQQGAFCCGLEGYPLHFSMEPE